VTPDLNLTPDAGWGIPIALLGAVLLALGAQFQHAGVVHVDNPDDGNKGLSIAQLLRLLRRPSWVIGTILLGLAVVFQLTSLTLAPISVVQPLGAVGLIVTAIVNARVSKVKLDRKSIRAIVFCVGGVALFVSVASFTTHQRPVTSGELSLILGILGGVILLFVLGLIFLRERFNAVAYIVSAGILFGFVATLASVVIARIKTLIVDEFERGSIEWLTIGCVVLLICAAILGSYFVQSAYANGPPDLVVAGLTVIDPVVAILIGIVILGEASSAPWWAIPAFIVAAALAIYGVFQLAKHHPQSQH
jgi:drug/metabolite transporter (DMT)-like permease